MSTLSLVKSNYQGLEVNFTEDGWFNATSAADRFGKRVDHYLSNLETKNYLEALCQDDNTRNSGDYIKTKRGKNGGTWFHPELAVHFARWLDIHFAIWCDRQIRKLISGSHPHFDWRRVRHEASSSYKVMNAVLQLVRQNNGKSTPFFHFANEAKLVNWAITGEFKPLDRNSLNHDELDLLAKLEERNAVLLGCGLGREDRKLALSKFASEFMAPAMIEMKATA